MDNPILVIVRIFLSLSGLYYTLILTGEVSVDVYCEVKRKSATFYMAIWPEGP